MYPFLWAIATDSGAHRETFQNSELGTKALRMRFWRGTSYTQGTRIDCSEQLMLHAFVEVVLAPSELSLFSVKLS